MKSNRKTANTPVILLTALTHRDALTRGWEAGADEYLFKPFHPKELTTRIQLLIKNARSNKLLKELNKKLISSARLAGRTEVATGILHNVGNILNSVNTTIYFLLKQVSESAVTRVEKLGELIETEFNNLEEFIHDKVKQANIIDYLQELSMILLNEQTIYLNEIKSLNQNIQTINDIIALQNNLDSPSGVLETLNLPQLIDEALEINLDSTSDIQVEKNYRVTQVNLDKVRLSQILVNLIKNAKEALIEAKQDDRKITISAQNIIQDKTEWLEIDVTDNAMGIDEEQLSKIFIFGYTSKAKGKGFGLHISAISAKEMGGSLKAFSKGKNCGASFVILLPVKPTDSEQWIELT